MFGMLSVVTIVLVIWGDIGSTQEMMQSNLGIGGQKMANEKRLIDANALKERAIRVSTVKEHCYMKAIGTHEIDKAPTVDAVEVVRCKDCKWYEANCETCVLHSDDGDTYDFGYDVNMKPDDFCSYGERKDNDS
jgi:hypothetical protein